MGNNIKKWGEKTLNLNNKYLYEIINVRKLCYTIEDTDTIHSGLKECIMKVLCNYIRLLRKLEKE